MPKKNKRGQGEGSIRERFKTTKDGKKVSIGWEARYTAGIDKNGKQIQRSIYAKSSEEIKKKLRKILTSIDSGTYVEPTKITVESWLNTWLWDYKRASLKPTSFMRYEITSRVHIIPTLGNTLLKDLKPAHVQKLINDKYREGLSARSVEYIHITLHNALDIALKNGLVTTNISKAVTLPRDEKKEIRVLTIDEQQKFIEAIKGHRFEAAFILDLYTGLRLGELLSLRWKDIDLKEGVLRVCGNVQRIKTYNDEGKKTEVVIQNSTKTKAGQRTIPLLDEVIPILEKHKKNQDWEKRVGGKSYKDNDFVFCDEFGGIVEPRKLTYHFDSLTTIAGIGKVKMPRGWKPGKPLPQKFKFPEWFQPPEDWKPGEPLPKDFKLPEGVNFHALRHTFATRALERGIPPKVVQEILGHTSITMTLDLYTHVLPETKKDAIQKLKGAFKIG